jgi:hypothetical protein
VLRPVLAPPTPTLAPTPLELEAAEAPVDCAPDVDAARPS